MAFVFPCGFWLFSEPTKLPYARPSKQVKRSAADKIVNQFQVERMEDQSSKGRCRDNGLLSSNVLSVLRRCSKKSRRADANESAQSKSPPSLYGC